MQELFDQNVKDAFFDLDKSDLRADARDALTKDAEFLRSYPQVRVSLEGHCDERGSTEYNLGLGQRRAEAAKNLSDFARHHGRPRGNNQLGQGTSLLHATITKSAGSRIAERTSSWLTKS